MKNSTTKSKTNIKDEVNPSRMTPARTIHNESLKQETTKNNIDVKVEPTKPLSARQKRSIEKGTP
jgi:hypothetical protein